MQKKALITIGIVLLVLVGAVFMRSTKDTSNFDRIKDQVMPQLVPAGNKDKVPIVTKEFLPDIDIAYVLDYKKRYNFIYEEKLEQWGIDERRLEQVAMRNLEKLVKDTEIKMSRATKLDGQAENAEYGVIEIRDGYAATRILSPNIRKSMVEQLGEPFIAAIPSRDFLIFWPEGFYFMEDFREQVRTEFETAELYGLSPHLLKVTQAKVEQLEPAAIPKVVTE